MVVNIILICAWLYADRVSYHKNLDACTEELPVVRLAEIEENLDLVQDKSTTEEIDYGNYVSYKWSILASNIYEVSEEGVVPNEMWLDGSGEYMPSARTEFYELRFQFLVKPLVNELVDSIRKNDLYEEVIYEEIKDPRFSSLSVTKRDNSEVIVASRNNRVMVLRYWGDEELTEHLDAIYAAMTKE